MTGFSSTSGDRISSFLNYHTTRSFKRETRLQHLIKFDRWCMQAHPERTLLSRKLILDWIYDASTPNYDVAQWVASIRQFARCLCAIGEEAYILPEKYAPIRSKTTAYTFTDIELTALSRAANQLSSTKKESFLSETTPVLLRLIYTCGLRPDEGQELLVQDVNLKTGEILIIRTKRNKKHFVVMSDDMLELARKYAQQWKTFCGESPYFSPSANSGALAAETMHSAFNRTWSHANLSEKYPRKVRVYDLRHHFASVCLNRWFDNGESPMAMLPFLREYMGHNSLSETAYYIHILPENIIKSSTIDWEKFNAMFPEVTE